ncbi:E1-E2 ATPase-domain-containing protein [Morchella snyderi]|nr:E1-E2 ATPase-domain-containing protein [Morchella snyderi]
MTCTGCADKVVHVLQSMNCVLSASVKVSFLNNRAEVTFWPEFRGENEIVEILRKKTGFRVAVMGSGCIEDAGLAKVRITIRDEESPDGIEKMDEVRRMRTLGHENGRILLEVGYDPAIVGVRDLLRCINNNVKFDANIVDTPNEDTVASEAERRHLKRLGIITLVSAMLTVPVLILAWAPLPNIEMSHKYTIQLPLATVVMGVAYRIYISAFRTMIYGGAGGSRIDMDVLVLVATLAAWGFSVSIFMIDTISGTLGTTGKEPFFETCCLLVTLILAGRWITGMVRMWALNRVLALGDEHQRERSKKVFLVEGGIIREINEKLLQYADVLAVMKGGVIATDGVVIEGEAEVDESLLTGEAAPADVEVGRLVIAGSNVVSGKLKYRVTRLMHENTVSVIKRMVRSAGGEKPKVQEMADSFATIMTPAVLFVSLAVFIIWLLVNRLGRNEGWSDSAVEAVSFAVATLAVSCPCAIGLAVPMVMIFASRVAMRKSGFLFVNVIAVERGLKANKVVFDKTGTLTTGKLKVVFEKEYTGVGWSAEVGDQIRTLVKTLCEGEKHPVSEALATSVSQALGYVHPDVTVETVVGKGLEATIEGQLVRGGQPSWCSHNGNSHRVVNEVVQQGLTVFALSIDGELRAVFGLEDTIRPEAQEVITELHRRCIETYIFSGDHAHAVTKISKVLGIPEGNCRSGCSPEQKSSEIKKLQIQLQPTRVENRNGPVLKRPIVLFLGDGTNDAIALKQADVGLSMSDSTSVAISAADVAILSTSLTSVISFLDLSRRVRTCIWISFAYGVLWNFLAVIAAGGGFVAVRISPEWAGLGELGSVLPVVIIAAFVGIRWERKMAYG